jgi:hypothetical protein
MTVATTRTACFTEHYLGCKQLPSTRTSGGGVKTDAHGEENPTSWELLGKCGSQPSVRVTGDTAKADQRNSDYTTM